MEVRSIMQTKEQIQQIIVQLKARTLELNEEQKVIERELYRYIGRLETLIEIEKPIPPP